jgi:hypothetical protein
MIAMKFTIELDIGLSFLLQAALPQLVTDRETKTHRRGRSKRSYGHCRHRTEIPEAEPSPAARPRDGPHCRRAEVKLPQDPPGDRYRDGTHIRTTPRPGDRGVPHPWNRDARADQLSSVASASGASQRLMPKLRLASLVRQRHPVRSARGAWLRARVDRQAGSRSPDRGARRGGHRPRADLRGQEVRRDRGPAGAAGTVGVCARWRCDRGAHARSARAPQPKMAPAGGGATRSTRQTAPNAPLARTTSCLARWPCIGTRSTPRTWLGRRVAGWAGLRWVGSRTASQCRSIP